MARAKKQDPEILEIGGVPTVAGLARQGRHLAYVLPDGRYHITAQGHALLGDAMRANAQQAILEGKGRWRQPPSREKRAGA